MPGLWGTEYSVIAGLYMYVVVVIDFIRRSWISVNGICTNTYSVIGGDGDV